MKNKQTRNRKSGIIQDKKLRGEWAESVFMERATEHGLAVSKPWGEMRSYDFVLGKTGRFISVQVKSTTCKLDDGYECTVRSGHRRYPVGSFDFLAAYAVLEDTWYIIPAEEVQGKKVITLFPNSKTAKYEKYREAWDLLREAAEDAEGSRSSGEAGVEEEAATPVGGIHPADTFARMRMVQDFVRRAMRGEGPKR